MKATIFIRILLLAFMSIPLTAQEPAPYGSLAALFREWREFEKPPLKDSAPDYTEAGRKERGEGSAEEVRAADRATHRRVQHARRHG